MADTPAQRMARMRDRRRHGAMHACPDCGYLHHGTDIANDALRTLDALLWAVQEAFDQADTATAQRALDRARLHLVTSLTQGT